MNSSSPRISQTLTLVVALAFAILLPALASADEPAKAADKGDVVLTVENLEGTDGHLLVWLFDSAETFPLDQENAYRAKKLVVKGTSLEVIFKDVPNFTYAMVLLHDADDDGSMNFGIMGPEEGRGVSQDASTLIGPPSFEEAS